MRRNSLTRREDLLKPDLLSEIVLLSSGVLILLALIVAFATALTRMSTLP